MVSPLRIRAQASVCALALAVLAAAGPARAQEAAPVPLAIALSPDGTQLEAALARDTGLIIRGEDDVYRMACTRALGISSNGSFFLAAREGGGFLLTHYGGVQHGDASGCGWTYPDPILEDLSVVSVARNGDTLHALTTSNGDYAVYRSDDGGETFDLGFDLDDDAAYFSLKVAPSDPDYVYLLAVITDLDTGESQRYVQRSLDGGETFERLPLNQDAAGNARLARVDPSDPARVYLAFTQGLSSHSHGDEMHVDDLLLVSDDGGESFSELRSIALFGGLSLGPADGEIFLGDAEGGLLHSDDGGQTWETLDEDLHVSCIEQRDGRLWACANSVSDPFSVGVSDDGGESFESVLRFDEVAGVVECDPPLTACAGVWTSWGFWHPLANENPDENPDAGTGATADAGGDATPVPSGEGDSGDGGSGADAGPAASGGGSGGDDDSGCRAAPGSAGGGWLLAATALTWLRRRRRGC
ncbi:MAG: sialidase family protein [Myxococcales bacterium]|jgi:hypothetical protein